MLSALITALFVTAGVACYYLAMRRRLETRSAQARVLEILAVASVLLAVLHLPRLGMVALWVILSVAAITWAVRALARWTQREAIAGDLRLQVEKPNSETLKCAAVGLVAYAVLVPMVFVSPLMQLISGDRAASSSHLLFYLISGALLAQAAVVFVLSLPIEFRENGIASAWRCVLWTDIQEIDWRLGEGSGAQALIVRSGERTVTISVPERHLEAVRQVLAEVRGSDASLASLATAAAIVEQPGSAVIDVDQSGSVTSEPAN